MYLHKYMFKFPPAYSVDNYSLDIIIRLVVARRQVSAVPSDSGWLWFVRPNLSSGIRGGSAGGHQPQCRVLAKQGAAVDGVECSGQPAY